VSSYHRHPCRSDVTGTLFSYGFLLVVQCGPNVLFLKHCGAQGRMTSVVRIIRTFSFVRRQGCQQMTRRHHSSAASRRRNLGFPGENCNRCSTSFHISTDFIWRTRATTDIPSRTTRSSDIELVTRVITWQLISPPFNRPLCNNSPRQRVHPEIPLFQRLT
jgi:hypothetical protein